MGTSSAVSHQGHSHQQYADSEETIDTSSSTATSGPFNENQLQHSVIHPDPRVDFSLDRTLVPGETLPRLQSNSSTTKENRESKQARTDNAPPLHVVPPKELNIYQSNHQRQIFAQRPNYYVRTPVINQIQPTSSVTSITKPLANTDCSSNGLPSESSTENPFTLAARSSNAPNFNYQPGPVPLAAGDIAKTWIFPKSDKYAERKYQLDIAQSAILQNTLVSLPTGLGKTLIASVVMYNFYRWFPTGKVIFLAPTRPLVTQQIEACYKVMGIPERHTAEISGRTKPSIRVELWTTRRVFFCTPQTLQKDIEENRCDAKMIVCICFDEAHKATGKYAYANVINLIENAGAKFRVVRELIFLVLDIVWDTSLFTRKPILCLYIFPFSFCSWDYLQLPVKTYKLSNR